MPDNGRGQANGRYGEIVMSKGMDRRKETKKKPQMTPAQKRAAKAEKKKK
jgi:hypothetical protein